MLRDDKATRLYVEVERCEPTDGDGGPPTGIIRAQGQVDLDTVDQLVDKLDPNLWSGCSGLLLDLTEVTFIDSSGISAVVMASTRLANAGLRFAVKTGARTQVEGVLELTGIRALIPTAL